MKTTQNSVFLGCFRSAEGFFLSSGFGCLFCCNDQLSDFFFFWQPEQIFLEELVTIQEQPCVYTATESYLQTCLAAQATELCLVAFMFRELQGTDGLCEHPSSLPSQFASRNLFSFQKSWFIHFSDSFLYCSGLSRIHLYGICNEMLIGFYC